LRGVRAMIEHPLENAAEAYGARLRGSVESPYASG